MARYNVNFHLSVEDMDLIEQALRRSKSELSAQEMPNYASTHPAETAPCAGGRDKEIRRIHDLLGRLHNQKVFYRPKTRPFISG